MQKFYFTFGQKYRYEPHPSGLLADPDGYVEIAANSEDEARQKMVGLYGQCWGASYDKCPDTKLFPKGTIATYE